MTLIAQIDDSACLGHGDCVHAAPGVFILEGDVAEQQAPGTDDQLRASGARLPRRRDHPLRCRDAATRLIRSANGG